MKQNQICTCTHTMKHHKVTGRCRKGCECKAAAIKARVKELRARG